MEEQVSQASCIVSILGGIQNQSGDGQLTSPSSQLCFEQVCWTGQSHLHHSSFLWSSAWPNDYFFSMRQVVLWIRRNQWILYTLTLARLLTLSPIVYLKPNWWGMYWITGLIVWWKIGVVVTGTKSTWQVVIRGGLLRVQYWNQYCLVSSLTTWMMERPGTTNKLPRKVVELSFLWVFKSWLDMISSRLNWLNLLWAVHWIRWYLDVT